MVYLRRMKSAIPLTEPHRDSVGAHSNPYESARLLREYLLFHYATAQEIAGDLWVPLDSLEYPARCVAQCVDVSVLGAKSRALDLGCAVGRSTFELARWCGEVIGIDYSLNFIEAAESIRTGQSLAYECVAEGDLSKRLEAFLPLGVDPLRVSFEQGDAMALRDGLGVFDVVLMANLIDRLREPSKCLHSLAQLLKPGGQLVITSPYTWMVEYTPRENWIGGRMENGMPLGTLEGLRRILEPDFELVEACNLPFLIREHARKFQWSIAEGTRWKRRSLGERNSIA